MSHLNSILTKELKTKDNQEEANITTLKVEEEITNTNQETIPNQEENIQTDTPMDTQTHMKSTPTTKFLHLLLNPPLKVTKNDYYR